MKYEINLLSDNELAAVAAKSAEAVKTELSDKELQQVSGGNFVYMHNLIKAKNTTGGDFVQHMSNILAAMTTTENTVADNLKP